MVISNYCDLNLAVSALGRQLITYNHDKNAYFSKNSTKLKETVNPIRYSYLTLDIITPIFC